MFQKNVEVFAQPGPKAVFVPFRPDAGFPAGQIFLPDVSD